MSWLRRFQPQKKPSLGLDIGSGMLKAICVAKHHEQWQILSQGIELIQENAFAGREIKNFEPVALAIRKLSRQFRHSHETVNFAVAGSATLSKVIQMESHLPDHELAIAIELEADSLIPYPLEDVYVDFQAIGQSLTHPGMDDVLLSAVLKPIIDTRLTLIQEVAWRPNIVELESNALSHCYETFNASDDNIYVHVHCGLQLTFVHIYEAGQLSLSKEININCERLLQDIAIALQSDFKSINEGLTKQTLPVTDWPAQVYPIFTNQLQQQLQRLMDSYQTDNIAVYLSGALAMLPESIAWLQPDSPYQWQLYNPLTHATIDCPEPHFGPLLPIALGLSLRGGAPW